MGVGEEVDHGSFVSKTCFCLIIEMGMIWN